MYIVTYIIASPDMRLHYEYKEMAVVLPNLEGPYLYTRTKNKQNEQ